VYYTGNAYSGATGGDSRVDPLVFSRADHVGGSSTGCGQRARVDHEKKFNFQGAPPWTWHPTKCVHGGGDSLLPRRRLEAARLDRLRTATAVAVKGRKCENCVFGRKASVQPGGTLVSKKATTRCRVTNIEVHMGTFRKNNTVTRYMIDRRTIL